MTRSKTILRLAALAAGLALLLGGVALAAGDTSVDPLVTLSYLTGEFTETILARAQQLAQQSTRQTQQELLEQAQAIAQAANPAGSADLSTGYESRTLTPGQSLTVANGTEVLVLSGALSASAAVTDVTDGLLLSGGDLSACHLYVCVAAGTLTAHSESTVLVK